MGICASRPEVELFDRQRKSCCTLSQPGVSQAIHTNVSAGPPNNASCISERLKTFQAMGLLDAADCPELDVLLKSMCQIFDADMGLVSLFHQDHVWLYSAVGMPVGPLRWCFVTCPWTLLTKHPQTLVCEDMSADARTSSATPYCTSFLSAPIVASNGQRLGAVCIMYSKPRKIDAGMCRLANNFGELAIRIIERHVNLARKLSAAHQSLPGYLSKLGDAAASPGNTTCTPVCSAGQQSEIDPAQNSSESHHHHHHHLLNNKAAGPSDVVMSSLSLSAFEDTAEDVEATPTSRCAYDSHDQQQNHAQTKEDTHVAIPQQSHRNLHVTTEEAGADCNIKFWQDELQSLAEEVEASQAQAAPVDAEYLDGTVLDSTSICAARPRQWSLSEEDCDSQEPCMHTTVSGANTACKPMNGRGSSAGDTTAIQITSSVNAPEDSPEATLLLSAFHRMHRSQTSTWRACVLLVDTHRPGWPVLYADATWRLWSGYSRDDIIGRPLSSVVVPASPGCAAPRWEALSRQAAACDRFVLPGMAAAALPGQSHVAESALQSRTETTPCTSTTKACDVSSKQYVKLHVTNNDPGSARSTNNGNHAAFPEQECLALSTDARWSSSSTTPQSSSDFNSTHIDSILDSAAQLESEITSTEDDDHIATCNDDVIKPLDLSAKPRGGDRQAKQPGRMCVHQGRKQSAYIMDPLHVLTGACHPGAASHGASQRPTAIQAVSKGIMGDTFDLSFHPAAFDMLDDHTLPVGIPSQQHMTASWNVSGIYAVRLHKLGCIRRPTGAMEATAQVTSQYDAMPVSLAPKMFPGLKLRHMLGTGSYGVVFQGTWHTAPVVAKIQDIKTHVKEQHHSAELEVALGQAVDHPNLVRTIAHSAVQLPLEQDKQQVRTCVHDAIQQHLHSKRTAKQPLVKDITQDRRMSLASYMNKGLQEQQCANVNVNGLANSVGVSVPDGVAAPHVHRTRHQSSTVRLFTVQEFCTGGTLQSAIDSGQLRQGGVDCSCPVDMRQVLALAHDVASGMAYLAAHGIVHGDLSAANILLTARQHTVVDPQGALSDCQQGCSSSGTCTAQGAVPLQVCPVVAPSSASQVYWSGRQSRMSQEDVSTMPSFKSCASHEGGVFTRQGINGNCSSSPTAAFNPITGQVTNVDHTIFGINAHGGSIITSNMFPVVNRPSLSDCAAGGHCNAGHHASVCRGMGLYKSAAPVTAKLADFGKSRIMGPSQSWVSVGSYATITHMAPEVLLHRKVSAAADVYSFGVCLWQMITGLRPWSGYTHEEVLNCVSLQRGRLAWPDVQLVATHLTANAPVQQPEIQADINSNTVLKAAAGAADEQVGVRDDDNISKQPAGLRSWDKLRSLVPFRVTPGGGSKYVTAAHWMNTPGSCTRPNGNAHAVATSSSSIAVNAIVGALLGSTTSPPSAVVCHSTDDLHEASASASSQMCDKPCVWVRASGLSQCRQCGVSLPQLRALIQLGMSCMATEPSQRPTAETLCIQLEQIARMA